MKAIISWKRSLDALPRTNVKGRSAFSGIICYVAALQIAEFLCCKSLLFGVKKDRHI